jgi:hypothetical protein
MELLAVDVDVDDISEVALEVKVLEIAELDIEFVVVNPVLVEDEVKEVAVVEDELVPIILTFLDNSIVKGNNDSLLFATQVNELMLANTSFEASSSNII